MLEKKVKPTLWLCFDFDLCPENRVLLVVEVSTSNPPLIVMNQKEKRW